MFAVPLRLGRLACREILSQGLYLLLAAGTLLLILLSQFLPFFVDTESEIKLVKDLGLSSMVLCAGALAALHASTFLGADLEERTAVTLLSKPVGRGQYLAGKYLGILMAAAILFVPWTAALEYAAWHKASYLEFGRYAAAPFDWSVMQGAFLSFLEVGVLAASALALSCVLPPAVCLAAVLAVFVGGHLAEHVAILRRAWFVPNLSLFRLTDAFSLGARVPGLYLVWTFAYASAYSLFALGAGWICLRRKEIA